MKKALSPSFPEIKTTCFPLPFFTIKYHNSCFSPKLLFLLALLSGLLGPLAAQKNWTGAVSTDWNVDGNWNPAGVPTVNDDVVIPNKDTDPVISATAVAKTVHVQAGAQLSIGTTGSLEINGFIPGEGGQTTALFIQGTVSNDGTLNIGTVSSVGKIGLTIGLNGTLNNNANGQIFINRSFDTGLAAYGNMINAGYVEIGGSQSVGVFGLFVNVGGSTNTISGQISIDRASKYAISLFGSATGFTNFGSITIGASGNVGQYAVRNIGSPFHNSGCSALINILSNSIISTSGSGNNFTNSGTIIENASGNSNITNNSGIVQNLNGGTFTIANNTGTLTTATGDIWAGCTSTDWDEPTNWLDGSVPTATDNVTIPNVANDPEISAAALAKTVWVQVGGSLTIEAGASLTVNGSFFVDGFATQAMFNNGTVNNNGTLSIGSTTSCGNIGLRNTGIFNNSASGGSGQISIDNSTGIGIYNMGGTFTNAATITVGGSHNVGNYGLWNHQATFNNTGGQITVDRSIFIGLRNTSGTFTNEAAITIGGSHGVGQNGLWNDATFNNTGGQITIDRSSNTGLYNSSGTFTNAATIAIGGSHSVGQYGLRNFAEFNNNACATLSTHYPLYSVNTINNAGLFISNTTGAHSNSGTFNNNGVLSYPQGNPIPNMVNNEIIVKPISGSCTISPALSLGATVNFDIATQWFLDENLTQSAGTYNPATNTFSNSGVPTTFYFSINDPVGGCDRTVSIKITSGSAETCGNGTDDDCDGITDEGCGTPVQFCDAVENLTAMINALPEPPADATTKFWLTTSLEYAKMFYQMGFDDWAVAMLGPSLEYESFRYWIFNFNSTNPQKLTDAQKNFLDGAALDLITSINDGTATCGGTRPGDGSVTGVVGHEPNASEVKVLVSPNPTSGPLSVQFFDFEKLAAGELRIFDATGRTVYRQTFEPGTSRLEIDLSEKRLANGFYTLRMRVGEQILTRKVSVLR